jgi:chromosome segregation ATPase
MAKKMTTLSSSASLEEVPVFNIQKSFIAAIVLGVLSIVLSQHYESPWAAVVLPVIIMLIYTAIGTYHGAAGNLIEQFGDSIYYQGFIFTLVALVMSLYFFNSESPNIDRLVSNFSLALITTILGLTIRIIINNFQTDSKSARRLIKEELDQSARSLIVSARRVSVKLETLHTEMHASHQQVISSLKEMLESATKSMSNATLSIEKHVEIGTQSLQENIDTSTNSLSKAFDHLNRSVEEWKFPEEKFLEKLDKPFKSFSIRVADTEAVLKDVTSHQRSVRDGSRRIAESISRIGDKFDKLEISLGQFAQSIEHDKESLEYMAQLSQNVSALASSMGAVVNNSEQYTKNTNQLNQNFDTFLRKIETLPQNIDIAIHQLHESGEAMRDVVKQFSLDADISGQLNTSMVKITEDFAHTSDQLESLQSIPVMVEHAVTHLKDYSAAVLNEKQTLENMRTMSNEQIEILKNHQKEMAAMLRESRETLATVNDHFLQAAVYVTKTLKE